MKNFIVDIFFTILTCLTYNLSYCQITINASDTTKKVEKKAILVKPKPPKVIRKEWSLGLKLNTNGWSGYFDMGKSQIKDLKLPERFYNVHLFQFEFSEKKSPREIKSNSAYPNPNGGNNTYIFGKINNFYSAKVGYGFRKIIAGKPTDAGAVSIHWLNGIGLAAGLLKPYYININGNQDVKFSPATSNEFLNPQNISGSSGFSKGIGETKFIPGFYYKTAFHFDFARSLKTVLAFEAGANVEYYSQPIPIMANITPVPYFVDLFIAFQIGKRR